MGKIIQDSSIQQEDLFASLAEQVKIQFMQISNAADLFRGGGVSSEKSAESIELASKAAINLIDSYLLSTELGRQQSLVLEPVSLSSVMYDVAQTVDEFAKLNKCEIQIHIGGKYAPVIANKRAIYSALTSLSLSFIELNVASLQKGKPEIKLSVRKNAHGISAGVFSQANELTNKILKQARGLKGKVHQPLRELDSSPSTGVFVADELVTKLQSSLIVSKFGEYRGLSANFPISQQLSLV